MTKASLQFAVGLFARFGFRPLLLSNRGWDMQLRGMPSATLLDTSGSVTDGAMILRFSSMDEMFDKMDHMHRWVHVRTH